MSEQIPDTVGVGGGINNRILLRPKRATYNQNDYNMMYGKRRDIGEIKATMPSVQN